MPQKVDFRLPWKLRVNPHLSTAREKNLEWMQRFGLLGQSKEEEASYLGWRLAEVTAYFYPDASAEGLYLATDLMGWYFAPFDDQFDGPLGRDPDAVARVCGALVDALHAPVESSAAPSVAAFRDIWQRSCAGMSPAWRARTAIDWTDYFAVHVVESQLRCGEISKGGIDAHMWRRRRSNGAFVVFDFAERVSGFEVTPVVLHHQVLSQMREIAADVVTLCQDTVSAEKEQRDGDRKNNILLLLEDDDGLSRSQAVTDVQQRTDALVQQFVSLERPATELTRLLPPDQREATYQYIRHLQDWMVGHDVWAQESSRYAVAPGAERDATTIPAQML